jgi:hypothetical protein
MFKQEGDRLIVTYGHGSCCTMVSSPDGTPENENAIVIQETEPRPIGTYDPSVIGLDVDELDGRVVLIRFENVAGFDVFYEKVQRLREVFDSKKKETEAA